MYVISIYTSLFSESPHVELLSKGFCPLLSANGGRQTSRASWQAVECNVPSIFKTPKSHSSGLVTAKCNRCGSWILPTILSHPNPNRPQQTITDHNRPNLAAQQHCFRIAGLCSGFGLGDAPLPDPRDPVEAKQAVLFRNFGLLRPGDQTLAEKSSSETLE